MRLALILAAASLCAAAPANAVSGVLTRAPDARACFERVYDAAHLARNPGQTIVRIRISVSREPMPGSTIKTPRDYLRVELTRRGDPEVRRAVGLCEHPLAARGSTREGGSRTLAGRAPAAF